MARRAVKKAKRRLSKPAPSTKKVRIYYESDFYAPTKRHKLRPVIKNRLVSRKTLRYNYMPMRKRRRVDGRLRVIYKKPSEERVVYYKGVPKRTAFDRRQRIQQQSRRLGIGRARITNYRFQTPKIFIAYDSNMVSDDRAYGISVRRFFMDMIKERKRRHKHKPTFYRLQVAYHAYHNATARGRSYKDFDVGGAATETMDSAVYDTMAALDMAIMLGHSGETGVIFKAMITFIEER